MPSRIISSLIGLWLLTSTFMWPQSRAHFHSTWMIGLLVACASIALIAGSHSARVVMFLLGIGLLLSTTLPDVSYAIRVHQILLAVAIALIALVPRYPPRVEREVLP
jgi:hypothetical protein